MAKPNGRQDRRGGRPRGAAVAADGRALLKARNAQTAAVRPLPGVHRIFVNEGPARMSFDLGEAAPMVIGANGSLTVHPDYT